MTIVFNKEKTSVLKTEVSDVEMEVYKSLYGKYPFSGIVCSGNNVILPYLGNCLSHTDHTSRSMLVDILYQLSILNSAGYAHCDLSFENILFDGKNYHLIDFEHCRTLGSPIDPDRRPYKDYLRCHEIYETENPVITEKIDVWVLGRLFVLWYNGIQLESLRTAPFREILNHTMENLPKKYQNLLSGMTEFRDTKRKTPKELMDEFIDNK